MVIRFEMNSSTKISLVLTDGVTISRASNPNYVELGLYRLYFIGEFNMAMEGKMFTKSDGRQFECFLHCLYERYGFVSFPFNAK